MTRLLSGIGLLLLIISCNYFKPEQEPEALARANDSYLYKDEIKDLVSPGTSKEDSAAIIKNYIDRWAANKLLFNAAEINLSESKKTGFDNLVKEYKLDLYTKGYIEEIVKRSVDTIISAEELSNYYNENKENFRNNSTLVKLRYIVIQKDNPKLAAIRSHFFDFRKSDNKFWDAHLLQLKDHALNDTTWIDLGQVYSRLKFINPDNKKQFISAGKSTQFPVDDDIYMIKITNVLDTNQISPFEYVKPTLKEVILNKRKLELIKKFEKEIIDDAIKDDKYEIYK